jgi:hypothetical protein
MKAKLKRLHSPDVDDLKRFTSATPDVFSFLLQIIVGPLGEEGEESFDVIVCTPLWLQREVEREGIIMGRHYLFVNTYDYDRLENYIRSRCEEATGTSWQEIAQKLSRLGRWEFEDYQP